MAVIRFDPTHQGAAKPIGATTGLPGISVKPAHSGIGGPLFAHLGHFANPSVIAAGHNTGGVYRTPGKQK